MMQYPSLKAVLQYLEANERFELALRCPTLRNVDKATPLFINYLEFETNRTTINRVVHNLGLVNEFLMKKGRILEKLVLGDGFDLDDFGEVDGTGIILPGDVRIQPAGNEVDLNRLRYRTYCEKFPPFYIQYAKGHLRMHTTSLEKLEYNKKMYEAMKYLNNRFFGGRKHPVTVKKLKFPVTEGVLRLPEHQKLRAQELYIGSNVGYIFNSIKPILHGNPRQVTVYAGSAVGLNYEHPVIKSAQKFMMENVSGDLSEILMNVTNQEVGVRRKTIHITLCMDLIDKIIEEKTSIHRTYSFVGNETFSYLFDAIKQRPGWVITEAKHRGNLSRHFRYAYNFPINESFNISVRCEPFGSLNEPWILWIEVDNKPIAMPLENIPKPRVADVIRKFEALSC